MSFVFVRATKNLSTVAENNMNAFYSVKIVVGTRGLGNTVIVLCPYCKKHHRHTLTKNDSLIRESDCVPGGKYQISVKN